MDEVEQAQLEEKFKAAQQQRLEACRAEIDQVLQRYKCTLVGVPQFQPDQRGAWNIAVSIGVALEK